MRAPFAIAAILPNATSRGRYLSPQSGATTTRPRVDMGQRARDPPGDGLGRLDLPGREVEHAQDDRLAAERLEHRAVEIGLRGLDRDLLDRCGAELGQEGIARRSLVDDRGIAEADVQRGRAGDAVERALDRGDAEFARLVGPGLHVGLVDLHDVGAGGEEILDLLVDRGGVVERHRGLALVEIVLRLLRHGEGARHGDLDRLVGAGFEEFQVAHPRPARGGGSCPPRAARGWDGRCGRARCPGFSRSTPSSAVAKRFGVASRGGSRRR